jgi:hypothetical protein
MSRVEQDAVHGGDGDTGPAACYIGAAYGKQEEADSKGFVRKIAKLSMGYTHEFSCKMNDGQLQHKLPIIPAGSRGNADTMSARAPIQETAGGACSAI